MALSHLKSFHTSPMPPRGRSGLSTTAQKRAKAKADAAKAKAEAVSRKVAAEEEQARAAAEEAAAREAERKEQEDQEDDERLIDMVISNYCRSKIIHDKPKLFSDFCAENIEFLY